MPTLTVTTNLFYHINPTENRYTLYWVIGESSITNNIDTYDWELQISATDDFAVYTSYNKSTALVYHDGKPVKGFDINLPQRVDKEETYVFARVRAFLGMDVSEYSQSIQIKIFPDFQEEIAENLLRNLPDGVYDKDLLLADPIDRDTNLFTIFRMYGDEFDRALLELGMVKTDRSIELCRDESLYDNFGTLFGFTKPLAMDSVQYREILRTMMKIIPYHGTTQSIVDVVMAFTGVAPTITNARDTIDLIAVDSDSNPLVRYLDDLGTPPVAITKNTAGFGITIYLNNPAGFVIDLVSLTKMLNITIPSHIYFTITQ